MLAVHSKAHEMLHRSSSRITIYEYGLLIIIRLRV